MKNRAAGFTLLELLLATVLCSMVMVGVLSMITRILADSTVVSAAGLKHDGERSPGPADFAVDAWVGLLADDLRHAMQVTADEPGRLVIVGYHALQDVGRSSVHAPVRVHYEMQMIGSTRWMVRRQVALNAATNEHVQRDLVCAGVTRWQLSQQQGPEAGSADLAPDPEPDGEPALEDPVAPSRPDDSYDNVVINGNNYFRRNVPAWYLKQQQGDHWNTSPPLSQTNEGAVAESDKPEAPRPRPLVVAKGTLWRLQAWCGDADEPDIDRLVIIR